MDLCSKVEQCLYERKSWWLVGDSVTLADILMYGVCEEAIRGAGQVSIRS